MAAAPPVVVAAAAPPPLPAIVVTVALQVTDEMPIVLSSLEPLVLLASSASVCSR